MFAVVDQSSAEGTSTVPAEAPQLVVGTPFVAAERMLVDVAVVGIRSCLAFAAVAGGPLTVYTVDPSLAAVGIPFAAVVVGTPSFGVVAERMFAVVGLRSSLAFAPFAGCSLEGL